MKPSLKISIVAAAITISACSDLTEMNVNPAAASKIDPNLQLSYVQHYDACYKRSFTNYMIYPGGWNNHFTNYSSMVSYGSKAVFKSSYAERLWNQNYPDVIKNVVDMYEQSEVGTNIHAAARVMKVEAFMRLTDVYGDIPYSESGNSYQTGIISPKYDRQEDIYNSFFEELDAAAKEFSEEGDHLSYDLYFHGDITKWRRYANSLRLRAALRLVKVNPEKAKKEAEAAINAGVMKSNEDIVYTLHEDSRDNMLGGNAFGNFIHLYQDSVYITDELCDALGGNSTNEDPRLRIIAGAYIDKKHLDATNPVDITAQVFDYYKKHQTVPAQCSRTIAADCTHEDISLSDIKIMVNGQEITVSQHWQRLRATPLIGAADSPYIKMSYAEVLLLQAEAASRYGVGTESVENLYRKAIKAGILQYSMWGADVKESDADNYSKLAPFSAASELEFINTQLWIDYVFNPFEAWANTRRTDGLPEKYTKYYNYYPTVNGSNGQMPRRLPYPATEQTRNEMNYTDAVSRIIGGDVWTGRVWWDCEI